MIITKFFSMIAMFLGFVFQKLPKVVELPWGLDTFLATGISALKGISHFFPPFYHVFVISIIYMTFRGVLLLLKTLLGNRAPHHA